MMSDVPINMNKLIRDLDKEIVRSAMIAELDVIDFFKIMATMTSNTKIKKNLLDRAKEEEANAGKFQALLRNIDKEPQTVTGKDKNGVEELL